MSPNPDTVEMVEDKKLTGKTKDINIKKFTEEVLGEAAKYQEHIEQIHGGKEALQAQAEKNGWSIEDQYQYAHELQKEEAEKNGVDVQEHYEKQIAALKAQQEQLQDALNKNLSKTSESKTDDSKAAKEIETKKEEADEINKVKEQESQKNESDREKEIQDANYTFETKKQELKQKYEDKVRKIQEGPPGYLKFFTAPWIFWTLAILDSAFSAVPDYLGGIFLEIIPAILGIVVYAIPLLILGNIGGLIIVVFFYLTDLAISTVIDFIGSFFPGFGSVIDAGLDMIPEGIVSRMGLSGYQIVKNSLERFQKKRLKRAEDKYKEEDVNLSERHRKKIKKINDTYDGKKAALLSKFSVDIDLHMQKLFSGTMLLFAIVFAWFGILGVDLNNFSLLPLILTGIFVILLFFFQKMGLMPA